ncbi:MAG TPA: hypothetical protein DCY05_07185 [Spirochaetaceae bacterium]|nr:hypothetical protein [Spirochaetaceae bacterium]
MVIEPFLDLGLGRQDYSYDTMVAEDPWDSAYSWHAGCRLAFYDWNPRGLPLGLCLSVGYQYQDMGYHDAFDTELGYDYYINRLRIVAMASWPFLRNETGFLAVNAGAYYAPCLGGEYRGMGSSTYHVLSDAVLSPDIGLRAEFCVDLAVFSRGPKPAIVGLGLLVYLDIALSDSTIEPQENLTYWQLGFAFTVPVFL